MRRALPWLVAVLGAGLVAAGVAFFAAANRSPADFGWTSYAPLQPADAYDSSLTLTFGESWTVLWTGGHLLGGGLIVAGLLVLAALGGWLLGRRSGGGVSPGRPPGARPPS